MDMYPWGYIFLSESVYLGLAIAGKNYVYILFILKYSYLYIGRHR